MFNLDVFYLVWCIVYQKGGVGGVVVVIVQEEINGNGLGDIGLSVNYCLFGECGWCLEMVFIVGVIVFIGCVFYGLDWKVIECDDDDYICFVVFREQFIGNGVWQVNVGLLMVKIVDLVILFVNVGYVYLFLCGFGDIDSNFDMVNLGDVKFGGVVYFGVGVVFVFNECISFSLFFSDCISVCVFICF